MRKLVSLALAVLLALSLATPALACEKATVVKTGPLSCLPNSVAYAEPLLVDLPDGRVILGLTLAYRYPGGADAVTVIPAYDVPEVAQEYVCTLALGGKEIGVVALRDALKQLQEYDLQRAEAENQAIRKLMSY